MFVERQRRTANRDCFTIGGSTPRSTMERHRMLTGTCHCGAVRIEIPRRPRTLTSCNCSICRRYGTLWAYYKAADVRIVSKAGATDKYSWGRKGLAFVRCATCGCVTSWKRLKPRKVAYMGVNIRNFEPDDVDGIRVRHLDGAKTWKFLD